MTTDNRTNEQIVAEAICGRRYRSGTPGYLASTDNPTDYGDARSVLTALEAAGRLVDEQKVRDSIARAALEAATRVPVQGEPQVSESGALTLVEEVIAIHADRIGTHYEDCYKYHVACLAVAVKHRLGGENRAARE